MPDVKAHIQRTFPQTDDEILSFLRSSLRQPPQLVQQRVELGVALLLYSQSKNTEVVIETLYAMRRFERHITPDNALFQEFQSILSQHLDNPHRLIMQSATRGLTQMFFSANKDDRLAIVNQLYAAYTRASPDREEIAANGLIDILEAHLRKNLATTAATRRTLVDFSRDLLRSENEFILRKISKNLGHLSKFAFDHIDEILEWANAMMHDNSTSKRTLKAWFPRSIRTLAFQIQ